MPLRRDDFSRSGRRLPFFGPSVSAWAYSLEALAKHTASDVREWRVLTASVAFTPYRYHEPHRHRFLKAWCHVTNWSVYDRGLARRGDIRLWIDDAALADLIEPLRGKPSGRRMFSNLAIKAALALGAAFKLRLRKTEGSVLSLLELMSLTLPVPDLTTLARRRRTVSIDLAESPRQGPTDIVLDSTALLGSAIARKSRLGSTRNALQQQY